MGRTVPSLAMGAAQSKFGLDAAGHGCVALCTPLLGYGRLPLVVVILPGLSPTCIAPVMSHFLFPFQILFSLPSSTLMVPMLAPHIVCAPGCGRKHFLWPLCVVSEAFIVGIRCKSAQYFLYVKWKHVGKIIPYDCLRSWGLSINMRTETLNILHTSSAS